MSRRTKLLITALFLVLLSIPVVYLTLTWRPGKPLHFQLERIHQPSPEDSSDGRMLTIRVENSSSVDIYFYYAVLAEGKAEPNFANQSGSIDPQFQSEKVTQGEGDVICIRARSTIHLTGYLRPELLPAAQRGRIITHYYWHSQAKQQLNQGSLWLYLHSPQALKDHIVAVPVDVEAAPLEVTSSVEIPSAQPAQLIGPARE